MITIERSTSSVRTSRAGRLMRSLAGIDEAVLKRAPQDRQRFTSLGVILAMGTLVNLIAIVVAIQTVFKEVPTGLPIVLAVTVAGFLLAVDRWALRAIPLTGRRVWRLTTLLPILLVDLVISLILGNSIAIRVFDGPILDEIYNSRIEDMIKYESDLRGCNQPPEAAAPISSSPVCADRLLAVPNKIPQITADLRAHEQTLEQDRNTPQAAADAAKVTSLKKSLADAKQAYSEAAEIEITARVQEYRASQRTIGPLDINEAFANLRARNIYVNTIAWALVVLLIGFRTAPMLSRLAAGPTAYDKLASREYQQIEVMRQIRARVVERVARWDEP
ncbi:DUF4407 domain-containing protein [Actinoplanes sp. NPDC026619]|uniref:DUF4407 domain-containing protein n=1 Tax=Actinoplanes sp. NPDC026619 TaxID=3155798 RepID=UPI0034096C52